MANLDTRSKRASSVQVLSPWVLAPPAPDGLIGQGDRQHIAWTYSGIDASNPTAGNEGFRIRALVLDTNETTRKAMIVS
ncbi:MAG TPA: hypothetical protein VNL15_06065 [Dehalococcoidia bacterium]|nr:hypothetical protein [Dehalococcoidia bacterium]